MTLLGAALSLFALFAAVGRIAFALTGPVISWRQPADQSTPAERWPHDASAWQSIGSRRQGGRPAAAPGELRATVD
ncbi:MAG TPA: hypothetical protein VI316_02435, partial [Candidatus Dormibacteraeota bacterium]